MKLWLKVTAWERSRDIRRARFFCLFPRAKTAICSAFGARLALSERCVSRNVSQRTVCLARPGRQLPPSQRETQRFGRETRRRTVSRPLNQVSSRQRSRLDAFAALAPLSRIADNAHYVSTHNVTPPPTPAVRLDTTTSAAHATLIRPRQPLYGWPMRRLQAVAIGIVSLAILTGCATGAGNAGAASPRRRPPLRRRPRSPNSRWSRQKRRLKPGSMRQRSRPARSPRRAPPPDLTPTKGGPADLSPRSRRTGESPTRQLPKSSAGSERTPPLTSSQPPSGRCPTIRASLLRWSATFRAITRIKESSTQSPSGAMGSQCGQRSPRSPNQPSAPNFQRVASGASLARANH